MDYAALFLAGTAGLVIGGGIAFAAMISKVRYYKMVNRSLNSLVEYRSEARDRFCDALNTLRASCFITNSRGHRVRYVNATPAERARAEGEA